MKKHLLITLMLSILIPGVARAMIAKGDPENKTLKTFEETIVKMLVKLRNNQSSVSKNSDKEQRKLSKFIKSGKRLIERSQELRKRKKHETKREAHKEEIAKSTWSKRQRIALFIAPTVLAGAGLATWYFWDKKPVKIVKIWLSKTFASLYRRPKNGQFS